MERDESRIAHAEALDAFDESLGRSPRLCPAVERDRRDSALPSRGVEVYDPATHTIVRLFAPPAPEGTDGRE